MTRGNDASTEERSIGADTAGSPLEADTASFTAAITTEEATFDGDDAALLRAVDETGSVAGAAAALGRSRARALTRLEQVEESFGSLVERHRGGADGGGSRLTDDARALLARFDRLCAALAGTAGARESVLRGEVRRRDGELAVVDTEAGAVRALAVDDPDAGTTVEVSVRSDTVTVHAAEASPPPDATSARNQFEGTTVAVDHGAAVVEVTVAITDDARLRALVTAESQSRLTLEPDTPVVVSFKATATRAVPTVD